MQPAAHHQYLLPVLGTTRRLRALGVMGWSLADVATRTSLSKKTLSLLMAGAQGASPGRLPSRSAARTTACACAVACSRAGRRPALSKGGCRPLRGTRTTWTT